MLTETGVVMPPIVTGAETTLAPGVTEPMGVMGNASGMASQSSVRTENDLVNAKLGTVKETVVVVSHAGDATWRTQTESPLWTVLLADVKAPVHPIEYSPPIIDTGAP